MIDDDGNNDDDDSDHHHHDNNKGFPSPKGTDLSSSDEEDDMTAGSFVFQNTLRSHLDQWKPPTIV